MPHPFEVNEQIELAATPEQVWEAIATGPGVDSWFMGRNELESKEGGRVRMSLLGHTEESTITAWEPGKRLAFRSGQNPDGTFMAFEYLIEGRDQGSTTLRFVHNGFLGDDWEEQYDALRVGDRMYLEKLALYVRHFPGRTASYALFAPGPRTTDYDGVWAAFRAAFGVDGQDVRTGDAARLSVPGLEPVDGTIEIVREPNFLGMRTAEGIYLLIHGYLDGVVAEYHAFTDVDAERTERAWNEWLAGLPA